jgi:hypothetical protein
MVNGEKPIQSNNSKSGRLRPSTIHYSPIVNFSLLYEEKLKHRGRDNGMIVAI